MYLCVRLTGLTVSVQLESY